MTTGSCPTPTTVTCDQYAAPTGSDSSVGTLAAPFATAQHLADSLSPGQTGCLRGGTYAMTEGQIARKERTPSLEGLRKLFDDTRPILKSLSLAA